MLGSAVVASRQRILRFFGPRGDLLVAESPGLVVYDSQGRERVRTAVEGLLDVAPVGEELWVVTPDAMVGVYVSAVASAGLLAGGLVWVGETS